MEAAQPYEGVSFYFSRPSLRGRVQGSGGIRKEVGSEDWNIAGALCYQWNSMKLGFV